MLCCVGGKKGGTKVIFFVIYNQTKVFGKSALSFLRRSRWSLPKLVQHIKRSRLKLKNKEHHDQNTSFFNYWQVVFVLNTHNEPNYA